MKQILIVLLIIFYAGCGTGSEDTGISGLSSIVAMSPSNGDMDVAPDSDVIVEFNKVADSSLTLTLTDIETGAKVNATPITKGNTAIFGTSLQPATTYYAKLMLPIRLKYFDSKMTHVVRKEWTFMTSDPTWGPMRIATVDPAPLATDVSVDSLISIYFSELPDAATLEKSVSVTGTEGIITGTTIYSESFKAIYFRPSVQLIPGSTYTVDVSGVKDMAGNTIPNYIWVFTTKLREV